LHARINLSNPRPVFSCTCVMNLPAPALNAESVLKADDA
jgi:hypothetical protein